MGELLTVMLSTSTRVQEDNEIMRGRFVPAFLA
jgi:hypothetical protein